MIYNSKYNPKLSKTCKICIDYHRKEDERSRRNESKEKCKIKTVWRTTTCLNQNMISRARYKIKKTCYILRWYIHRKNAKIRWKLFLKSIYKSKSWSIDMEAAIKSFKSKSMLKVSLNNKSSFEALRPRLIMGSWFLI